MTADPDHQTVPLRRPDASEFHARLVMRDRRAGRPVVSIGVGLGFCGWAAAKAVREPTGIGPVTHTPTRYEAIFSKVNPQGCLEFSGFHGVGYLSHQLNLRP